MPEGLRYREREEPARPARVKWKAPSPRVGTSVDIVVRSALGQTVAAAFCICCAVAPVAAADGGPPPAIAQYTEVIPTASGHSAKPRTSTKNDLSSAVQRDLRKNGGSDAAALQRIVADESPPPTQSTPPSSHPSKSAHRSKTGLHVSKQGAVSKTRLRSQWIRATSQGALRREVAIPSLASALAASIGSGMWVLVLPLGLLALAIAYGAGRRRGASVR